MDILEFRARLVATNGEPLKMLGIYDNFPILFGVPVEELSRLLLEKPGFALSKRPPHLTFLNEAGAASAIQLRNDPHDGYVSTFYLHADYDLIGCQDLAPGVWLSAIRDATVAIIDTVVEHRIRARFMHHYHPESRPDVDYVPGLPSQ